MTNERRCGNCKYWGEPDDRGAKFRRCRAVIHDKRSEIATEEWDTPLEERDWLPEDVRRELIAIRDSARAVVKDGSGYYAALKCREDFACILWEERPGLEAES